MEIVLDKAFQGEEESQPCKVLLWTLVGNQEAPGGLAAGAEEVDGEQQWGDRGDPGDSRGLEGRLR